jgi:hypothetical protein
VVFITLFPASPQRAGQENFFKKIFRIFLKKGLFLPLKFSDIIKSSVNTLLFCCDISVTHSVLYYNHSKGETPKQKIRPSGQPEMTRQ